MAKNLYLTATGPAAGKSVIALGLMSFLDREVQRVGFFRPIARPEDDPEQGIDPSVRLISSEFHLETDPQTMVGVANQQATEMITSGRYDDLLEEILGAYKRYERDLDLVLIEGTNYQGPTVAFEFDINADIARNLGAPVLLVVGARGQEAQEIYDSAILAKDQLDEHHCDLLGIIVNRVDTGKMAAIKDELSSRFQEAGLELAGVLPEDEILSRPRMDEIAAALGAEVLSGEQYLENLVSTFRIASMQLTSLLDRVDPGSLVITSGDRADILLGMLASQLSRATPPLSGILLSSGFRPSETVGRLIQGLQGVQVPVLAVDTGTYQTSIDVTNVRSRITPNSTRKIEIARILFENHVSEEVIRRGIQTVRSERQTPKLFLHNLLERARSNQQHIVLPEGAEQRILHAVDALMRRGVVKLTLLGDVDEIRNRAEHLKIKLDGVQLINPATSELLPRYAETYHKLREHKGVTIEIATDTMRDATYFGTMMVHLGDADGMVSGSINTTAHTVRPSFEFVKTRPGVNLVSSVFFMCLADRVLVYGDCAVNPNPTAEQLAQIAVSSADTAAAFGIEPRVAMLSYATGASGTGVDVDHVKEATRLARELRPELAIDGPLQYDAAVDAGVARTKLPDSSVAGRATVFIFPDLNTGNNTYKAVQRSANAIAVGPVLQGLRKPVNDLSRGCTVPDIVNTVAITAIQAQAITD